MVDVQQQPVIAQPFSIIERIWGWISTAWPYLVFLIIIAIILIVIYFLLKKLEDERKERDEANYSLYKQIKATCEVRADPMKIRKKWSMKSMFLLLIPMPIIWFAIPFIKTEHSAKYLDINGKLIGYYRGEYRSMDGTIYALMYKVKKFLFFEEEFVVKIPINVPYTREEKSQDGLNKRSTTKILNLADRYVPMNNGDVMLKAVDIEKLGQYYYCPVYYYDFEDKVDVIDYRAIMETAIHDSTNQLLLQRITGQMKKQMESMPSFNPFIVSAQKMPEKTKEEERTE